MIYRDSDFYILYGGTLQPLRHVPLRTLRAFAEDVHGSGVDPAHLDHLETNRDLDFENLSSSEFCALAKVPAACIKAETEKKSARRGDRVYPPRVGGRQARLVPAPKVCGLGLRP